MENKSLYILSHNTSTTVENKKLKKVVLLALSLITAYILASCGIKGAAVQQQEYKTVEQAVTPAVSSSPTVTSQPSPSPEAVSTEEPVITPTPSQARELSEEVIKFIEGSRPDGFDNLIPEEKVEALLKYVQQIMDYSSDVSNPTVKDTENFGKNVVLSAEEFELTQNVYNMIRNIAELSVDQPVNGKILDEKTKMGVFKEEYLNAAREFMLAQMDIRNGNDTYHHADAWYRYVISVMISAANQAYIPEYFYALKESEPEVRYADYYGVYFLDMANLEGYFPILTKNGVVYVGDINRRKYTLEQMQDFMNIESKNYNPNILIKGIKTEADLEKETVRKEIQTQEGIIIDKDKQKVIG